MRVGETLNIIKIKVIGLAKKVEKQSNIYKKQLFKCRNSLNKKIYYFLDNSLLILDQLHQFF